MLKLIWMSDWTMKMSNNQATIKEIETIISKLTKDFQHLAYVGKDYTIRDVRNDLIKIITRLTDEPKCPLSGE